MLQYSQVKKILLPLVAVIASCVIHVATVYAAPTSTYVQNLFITGLTDSSNPCLRTGSAGLVATTTCGSGSGGGVATTSPFSSGFIPLTSSSLALTNSNLFQVSSTGEILIGFITPSLASTILEASGTNIAFDANGGAVHFRNFNSTTGGAGTASDGSISVNNNALNITAPTNSNGRIIWQLQNGAETFRMASNGDFGIGSNSAGQRVEIGNQDNGSGVDTTKNLAVDIDNAATPTLVSSSTSGGNIASGTYFYRMSASDGVGEGLSSGQLGGVGVGGVGSGTINLSWAATQGAAFYTIYRSTSSLATFPASSFIASTTALTFADTVATPTAGTNNPNGTTAYVNKISSNGASWFNGGRIMFGVTTSTSGLVFINGSTTLGSGNSNGDGVINVPSGNGLVINNGITPTFRLLPFGNDVYLQNTNSTGDIYFTGNNAANLTGNIIFQNTQTAKFLGAVNVTSTLNVVGRTTLTSTTIAGNATTTNLTITGLGSSGNPCLVVSAVGVVSTSTCGSGGGSGGITTSSQGSYVLGNLFTVIDSSTASAYDGLNFNSSTGVFSFPSGTVAGPLTLGASNFVIKTSAGGNTGVWNTTVNGSVPLFELSNGGRVALTGGTSATPGIAFNAGRDVGFTYNGGASTNDGLYFVANGGTGSVWTATGLQIGSSTANPTNKLEVYGSFLQALGLANLASTTINGNVTTTNATVTSITGTQCLHSINGVISGVGADCDAPLGTGLLTTSTISYSQLLDSTTTVVTATSTNNTVLYSYTMPANTLGIGKTLRIMAMGNHVLGSAANPTITIKLLYGGQTVFSKASAAVNSSTAIGLWSENILFSNASGTTNVQLADSRFATVNGSGGANTNQMWNGSSTVDSTAQQTLQIQASMNQASASNTFSMSNLTLMLDGATTTVVTGGTGLNGAGAANQVAYFNGTNQVTSSANLAYNGSTETNSGFLKLTASSSIMTATIGGAIVSGGCDSVTTTVDASITSSTAAFITTPVNDPGTTLGGTWAYSLITAPGVLTTRVCANVTVTPNSTPYNVKIIQ